MNKKYRAIIWDYNGTLIDDVHTALASVNDILQKRHMPHITLEQYYSYLDTPISRFYEHLFDLNEVPFDELVQEFHQGYESHIQKDPLMENARLILALARDMELKQIILSASRQEQLEQETARLQIANYFDLISGADDFHAGSKVERGRAVMEQFMLNTGEAVVIGDSLHDYAVAKALQADCVLLSRGHQGKAELQTAGVPVIDDLIEVIPLLS